MCVSTTLHITVFSFASSGRFLFINCTCVQYLCLLCLFSFYVYFPFILFGCLSIWGPSWLLDITAWSHAKGNVLFQLPPSTLSPPPDHLLLLLQALLCVNICGDSKHPCLIPLGTFFNSGFSPSILTRIFRPRYTLSINLLSLQSSPMHPNQCSYSLLQLALSTAISLCTRHIHPGRSDRPSPLVLLVFLSRP